MDAVRRLWLSPRDPWHEEQRLARRRARRLRTAHRWGAVAAVGTTLAVVEPGHPAGWVALGVSAGARATVVLRQALRTPRSVPPSDAQAAVRSRPLPRWSAAAGPLRQARQAAAALDDVVARLPQGPLLVAGSDARDSAAQVLARMASTAGRVAACEQAARRVGTAERRDAVLAAVEPLLGDLRRDADRLDQLLAAAAELLATDGRQHADDVMQPSLASARLEEAVAALRALAAGLDEARAGRGPL